MQGGNRLHNQHALLLLALSLSVLREACFLVGRNDDPVRPFAHSRSNLTREPRALLSSGVELGGEADGRQSCAHCAH